VVQLKVPEVGGMFLMIHI